MEQNRFLLVLAVVGMAAYWYSIPIAVGVLFLLAALIISYRQIIFSYPHGGGAYVVSKENLGVNAGLIAGGSLLVDYILTVAVSVSAGTDAITSAFPSLHPHTVLIASLLVVFITTFKSSRIDRVGIHFSLSCLFVCFYGPVINWNG